MSREEPPMAFEEAVAELERVVRELESGELPLEDALDRFEEGVRLSRFCTRLLDSAQGRIEQLVSELNTDLARDTPFDPFA